MKGIIRSIGSEQETPVYFLDILHALKQDSRLLLIILGSVIVSFVYSQSDSSLIQYLTKADVSDLTLLISCMVGFNSLTVALFQFPLQSVTQSWNTQQRIYLGIA
ncbi:hypothetical protein [Algicola sagamiensis]|uniref:hypothetical protein n=1 Tax=Algicola sagamiensis TaxID=163869 RepID=UPI00037C9648|nr:hypothetical protein [Algicola sagamiensis]